MANPVTGPVEKFGGSGDMYTRYQWGFRQTRPYDQVLPYRESVGGILSRKGSFSIALDASRCVLLTRDRDVHSYNAAYNQAYARFLDRIGERATLGVTFAEGRQAFGMIAKRLGQLRAGLAAVRRFSPMGVARAFGYPEAPIRQVLRRNDKNHALSKSLADLFLELHFGWEPLVKDIQAALEVLDAPFKSVPVRGKGKAHKTRKSGGAYPASAVTAEQLMYRVSIGGEVSVTNPNLRLAQQMGLLNPFEIALELVPWSFVLGWFGNLQQYLGSFTDFAGLTFQNLYQSDRVDNVLEETWTACWGENWCTQSINDDLKQSRAIGWATVKSRDILLSVPRPKFGLKPYSLSPARAATAVSLLVQQLPTDRVQRFQPPPLRLKGYAW